MGQCRRTPGPHDPLRVPALRTRARGGGTVLSGWVRGPGCSVRGARAGRGARPGADSGPSPAAGLMTAPVTSERSSRKPGPPALSETGVWPHFTGGGRIGGVGPAERSEPIARGAHPGAGAVSRPALYERLGGPARVMVVSAPPGSGKTVLLRSWIGAAGLADRAAWVPVGRDERDPQRFWLSVLGALRRTTAGSALVQALTAAPDLWSTPAGRARRCGGCCCGPRSWTG